MYHFAVMKLCGRQSKAFENPVKGATKFFALTYGVLLFSVIEIRQH